MPLSVVDFTWKCMYAFVSGRITRRNMHAFVSGRITRRNMHAFVSGIFYLEVHACLCQ